MFEWLKPKRDKIQIYRAADGWRWRATANNNRTIADGAEAFDSQYNAERSAEDFIKRKFKIVILGNSGN
jgi:uncharacterized protein YegP (UPF0339 family)